MAAQLSAALRQESNHPEEPFPVVKLWELQNISIGIFGLRPGSNSVVGGLHRLVPSQRAIYLHEASSTTNAVEAGPSCGISSL